MPVFLNHLMGSSWSDSDNQICDSRGTDPLRPWNWLASPVSIYSSPWQHMLNAPHMKHPRFLYGPFWVSSMTFSTNSSTGKISKPKNRERKRFCSSPQSTYGNYSIVLAWWRTRGRPTIIVTITLCKYQTLAETRDLATISEFLKVSKNEYKGCRHIRSSDIIQVIHGGGYNISLQIIGPWCVTVFYLPKSTKSGH